MCESVRGKTYKSVRNKVSEGEFLKKTDPNTFLIRKRQTYSNFRPLRTRSHQLTRHLGADKVSGTSINSRFWVASHQYAEQTSKPAKGSADATQSICACSTALYEISRFWEPLLVHVSLFYMSDNFLG